VVGRETLYVFDLGKYDEAIEAWDEAIWLDPNYEKAWNNKGNAFAALGKYDDAIKAYDEAIRLDPNYAIPGTTRAVLSLSRACTMRPSRLVMRQSG
jgi:tetratricopeptide (TPR) repeat protein